MCPCSSRNSETSLTSEISPGMGSQSTWLPLSVLYPGINAAAKVWRWEEGETEGKILKFSFISEWLHGADLLTLWSGAFCFLFLFLKIIIYLKA